MIDSHCHLDHEPLFQKISGVLKRSKESGIKKLLTICTTIVGFNNIINILIINKSIVNYLNKKKPNSLYKKILNLY